MRQNRMRPRSDHAISLDMILTTPRLIGIHEPILWSAKEVRIYQPSTVQLATDIDVLYKTVNRMVAVEYKSSGGHRQDAVRQLDIAYWFIRRNFGVKPELYYVHGPRYEKERIK